MGLDNGFATDWPAVEGLGAGLPGRFTPLQGDLRDPSALGRSLPRATPGADGVPARRPGQRAPPGGPAGVHRGDQPPRAPAGVRGRLAPRPAPGGLRLLVPRLRPRPAGRGGRGRPYGALRDLAHLSKVYAEKLGEMMALTEGVPCSPVRLGIVYGLGPVTKSDLRFVTAPHAFCLRAIAGEPLPIHPADRTRRGTYTWRTPSRLAPGGRAADRPKGPTSRPTPCRKPHPRWTWPAWCSARPGRRGTTPRCAGTRPRRPRARGTPPGQPGGKRLPCGPCWTGPAGAPRAPWRRPCPDLRPLRRPGQTKSDSMSAPERESPRILLKARPLPQQLADRLARRRRTGWSCTSTRQT